MKIIDQAKYITNVFMFNGASDIQLGGDILNIRYPNMTVMHGVEHTISLLFNGVLKLPIVNQMIRAYK